MPKIEEAEVEAEEEGPLRMRERMLKLILNTILILIVMVT
jgi:hypothetical protein